MKRVSDVATSDVFANPERWIFPDGVEYKVSPLTFNDLGDLTQYIRSTVMRSVQEAVQDVGDSRIRREYIDAALEKMRKVDVLTGNEELNSFFGDTNVLTKVIHLSLRRCHNISHRQIGDMFTIRNVGECEKIVRRIFSISGIATEEDEDAPKMPATENGEGGEAKKPEPFQSGPAGEGSD